MTHNFKTRFVSLIALISLLTVALQIQPVLAQEPSQTFSLPDGTAGVAYRVNLEAVLRDNYHLRLETNARASLFRWAIAEGEFPPGLIVRTNGTIVGSPQRPRAEPYRFQLKVLALSLPNSEALTLNFSISISSSRVRLAHISTPRLVPAEGPDDPANTAVNAGTRQSPLNFARRLLDPSGRDSADLVNSSRSSETAREISRATTSDRVYASMLKTSQPVELPAVQPPPPACDSTTVLGPLPLGKVFVVDARNPVAPGERQFEKQDAVTVVIDNKNPYLYTYAYTEKKKTVDEPAISGFLGLIGGVVTEFAKGTTGDNAKDGDANPAAKVMTMKDEVKNRWRSQARAECIAYNNAFEALVVEVQAEIANSQDIADNQLKDLATANETRSRHYDALTTTLHDAQASGGELFCRSKELVGLPDPGASPHDIETVQKKIDNLRVEAQSFKVRVDLLSTTFPQCADQGPLNISLSLIRTTAEGLLADAGKYNNDLKKISADLKKMDDLKKTVQTALSNPRNFRETHTYGPYSRTAAISIGLSRKPLSSGDDDKAKSEDLVKEDETEFKFGHAPFFSLSGGLAFSPLRKVEFDRVQGFERDQQGNVVMVNGKPNLTTVVGLKEGSRTRITPLVLLNGRIHDKLGPIDGIHLSLGITAKNDNKGTDVEYIVGPSFSFLEDNMFLTLGGYAGRQQKLGGGLFQGFAVPSTVSDLPIEKNYRWNFGFALSYKIPVNKK